MFTSWAEAKTALANTPQRVIDMAHDIVQREGGYVDNPDDPGGATNHGISLPYARQHGLLFDFNGDGVVDASDIQQITVEQAVECFLMDFYKTPHFDALSEALQPEVMDFAVNAGCSEAVKALQQPLDRIRTARDDLARMVPVVTVDGELGPETENAARNCVKVLGESVVVNSYTTTRESYYRTIARDNPHLGIFLNGWIARAESFREHTN